MDSSEDIDNTSVTDFEKMTPGGQHEELSQEFLQRKLDQYSKAMKKELESASAATPESAEQFTRDYFQQFVPLAAGQIVWLSTNSSSEAIKLQASKYIIEAAFKHEEAESDPAKKILESLLSKAKTTSVEVKK